MLKLDDCVASRSFDDTKVKLLPTDKSLNEFRTVTIDVRRLLGLCSVAPSLFSRCELSGVPRGSRSGRNGRRLEVLPSSPAEGFGLDVGVWRYDWMLGV